MPSPICTVNGVNASLGFVAVPASSTPTIALANTAGVSRWAISCTSTDETTTAAAINATITINIVTKTATFLAPGPGGSALIFKSVVNNGKDAQGRNDPTLTTTFKVCVNTPLGYQVAAFGEQLEHSPSVGYIPVLNNAIRNATNTSASAGDGMVYLGGAYNVTAGDPSIVVNPDSIQVGVLQSDASHGTRGGGSQHALATTLSAGFMAPADKILLGTATALATPNTIVARDGTASTALATLTTTNVIASGTINATGSVLSPVFGSAAAGISTGSTLFRSGDAGTGTSGDVTLGSGAVTAGSGTATGVVFVRSGTVTGGTGSTGAVSLASGASAGNFASGPATVSTGATAGTVASGSANVSTGNATGTAASGQILLATGTTASTSTSGLVAVTTGSSTAGNTGALLMSTGATTGNNKTTGAISITSGGTSVLPGTSGAVSISSGNALGTSGAVSIATGTHTTTGVPGAISIGTPTVAVVNGQTGAISITTGGNTSAGAVSGAISVASGSGAVGSGPISVTSGPALGGTSGAITIETSGAGDASVKSGAVTIRTGSSAQADGVGRIRITAGAYLAGSSASPASDLALLVEGPGTTGQAGLKTPPLVLRAGDANAGAGSVAGTIMLVAGSTAQPPAAGNGSGWLLDYGTANYSYNYVGARFGGGAGVLSLRQAATAPTADVAGYCLLWFDGAALKVRLATGAVRTIQTV